MILSKLLILFIGEILCFPYVFARTFSLQEVHEDVLNELQKEIPVSHFPKRKPISKPQRRSTQGVWIPGLAEVISAIKNQKSINQQSTENRQTFNTAGYEPLGKLNSPNNINIVFNLNEFLDLYEQMFQDEW